MVTLKTPPKTRAPAKKRTPAVSPPKARVELAPTTKAKNKLVRDSFTIPKLEYVVLQQLKLRVPHITGGIATDCVADKCDRNVGVRIFDCFG